MGLFHIAFMDTEVGKFKGGKIVRKKRRRRVLKILKRQTGKRKSISADRKRKALAPGKRRSRTGKIYWETRKNRSDKVGKRL